MGGWRVLARATALNEPPSPNPLDHLPRQSVAHWTLPPSRLDCPDTSASTDWALHPQTESTQLASPRRCRQPLPLLPAHRDKLVFPYCPDSISARTTPVGGWGWILHSAPLSAFCTLCVLESGLWIRAQPTSDYFIPAAPHYAQPADALIGLASRGRDGRDRQTDKETARQKTGRPTTRTTHEARSDTATHGNTVIPRGGNDKRGRKTKRGREWPAAVDSSARGRTSATAPATTAEATATATSPTSPRSLRSPK